MLNQSVLVGRLASIEKDKKRFSVVVPRNFKNEVGEYDKDIIEITTGESIMDNVIKYCNPNDIIGVKGRLQKIEDKLMVVAEKVTFLSSSKVEETKDTKVEEA